MRCSAQLGDSLVTVCLLRHRPALVWFTLLLQALPFCCGLRPAAMGYALQRSLTVVAGCLGNGRLCQQWACISVGAGCLGNGRMHQQWACISVGASCLGNGRWPSPTERLWDRLLGRVWNRGFIRPTGLSQRLCFCSAQAGSLSESRLVSSPALSTLRLPAQQGTPTSVPCGGRWDGPATATPAAGFARQ